MSVSSSDSGGHRSGGKVAVLVDGDNVSASHASQLLLEAGRLGAVTVRRVYGVNHGKDWVAVGFSPIAVSPGKNATDMVLAIDAVDLKHRIGFESMVIASSDQDFAPLAHFLREAGVQVIGMGGEHAPSSFRAACSGFVFLRNGEKNASQNTVASVTPSDTARVSHMGDFEAQVVAVFTRAGKEGFLMKDLGPVLGHQNKLLINGRPEKTWRKWLTDRGHMFIVDPKGPDARVRLRPNGKAPAPKA